MVVTGRAPGEAASSAFDEFVAARSPALRRFAVLLLGDDGLAADAVQSALLKAWRRWERIGGLDHVEAYVRTLLLNEVRSERRRRRPREVLNATIPERHAPDATDTIAERDAVWQAIRRLPPRQRAVLVLRFYDDLTEAQTASELGCAVGTVKGYTARALASLRLDGRLASSSAPKEVPS